MKQLIFITAILASLLLSGCQMCTRQFGGTSTIKLPKGEKLKEATWKSNDLWYLTEPMEEGYVPQTKVFQESSLMGIAEGKVIFIEQR